MLICAYVMFTLFLLHANVTLGSRAVCDGSRMPEPHKLSPGDVGNRGRNGWRTVAFAGFQFHRGSSREWRVQSIILVFNFFLHGALPTFETILGEIGCIQ